VDGWVCPGSWADGQGGYHICCPTPAAHPAARRSPPAPPAPPASPPRPRPRPPCCRRAPAQEVCGQQPLCAAAGCGPGALPHQGAHAEGVGGDGPGCGGGLGARGAQPEPARAQPGAQAGAQRGGRGDGRGGGGAAEAHPQQQVEVRRAAGGVALAVWERGECVVWGWAAGACFRGEDPILSTPPRRTPPSLLLPHPSAPAGRCPAGGRSAPPPPPPTRASRTPRSATSRSRWRVRGGCCWCVGVGAGGGVAWVLVVWLLVLWLGQIWVGWCECVWQDAWWTAAATSMQCITLLTVFPVISLLCLCLPACRQGAVGAGARGQEGRGGQAHSRLQAQAPVQRQAPQGHHRQAVGGARCCWQLVLAVVPAGEAAAAG
jgi:hypothetical protein